jgi:hypothetical protein
VLVVGGGEVKLVDPWPVLVSVALPDDPDGAALDALGESLFEGRGSQPVAFPVVVPGLGW